MNGHPYLSFSNVHAVGTGRDIWCILAQYSSSSNFEEGFLAFVVVVVVVKKKQKQKETTLQNKTSFIIAVIPLQEKTK